jgi:hypothetical protein
MLRTKTARFSLSLLVLALAVMPGLASAGSGFTATVVSGSNPFENCSLGMAPGATVYLDAEVEPWVAVNPANPNNIIGAWQQDRWSDGGAHGLVAGYSTNGGKTWGISPLPFSTCADATVPYNRASDPWISIGPDGTAYTISISFNGEDPKNAVYAATSTDGGKTWNNNTALIRDDAPNYQFFNDKESVTADPVKAGFAYATWDRLEGPTDNPRGSLHTRAYTAPTYFSMTTDGGRTWSTPKVIVPTKQNQQTIGNQIVVDPATGTVYDFFDWITTPNNYPYHVAFVKSTDGGATWTPPQIIAELRTAYVTDPNTGQFIRTGDIIPEPAIDPATGKLYVVWQDSRFNSGQYDEVAISSSSDGGTTWSAPVPVNTPAGRPAFTPSVGVNSRGMVGVTYYDFRNLQAGNTSTLPTDYWFTSSKDGGATFGGETHLAGPFDMLTAPYASGYFTGDYEGLAVAGKSFVPFFVAANSGNTGNRTDVLAGSLTP